MHILTKPDNEISTNFEKKNAEFESPVLVFFFADLTICQFKTIFETTFANYRHYKDMLKLHSQFNTKCLIEQFDARRESQSDGYRFATKVVGT